MDIGARTALAAALVADDGLPGRVAAAFYSRHPEWTTRFGAAGQRASVEDGRSHVSFLASAVQAGSAEIFAEYMSWSADYLRARGIDSADLAEYLRLLAESLSPELEGRAYVSSFLAEAEAMLGRKPLPAEPKDDRTPMRLAYLSAALAGQVDEAWEATCEARRLGFEPREIYRELLLWSQRRLGELWSATTISVAQEHMASAVTQTVLSRLYTTMPRKRTAGRALIAGVESEFHALPARFIADFLELDGWDVAFVGTNLALANMLDAVEREKPDVLGLSTTMATQLPATIALVGALRGKFEGLPIVLGGRAVRHASKLGEELAIDVDTTDEGAAFRGYAR